jgi:hypothetical protein
MERGGGRPLPRLMTGQVASGFAAAEGAPGKPRFSPVFYLADLKWARKQATRGRKISHCCAALRLSR